MPFIIDRHSGIELLRILAMYLILLLHANFYLFGNPDFCNITVNPLTVVGRTFAEYLCIVSVNVFVFISGWFSIKPSIKGFLNLILQVFSYSLLFIIIRLFKDNNVMSFYEVLKDILIVGKDYWFIVSYLLLYILAPVLNSFINASSRIVIIRVLFSFFSFELLYGWMNGLENFNYGYSTLSFIGLYLLSRYLSIYGCDLLNINKWLCLLYYFGLSLLSVLCYIGIQFFSPIGHQSPFFYAYNNPLILLASLYFFLFFVKLEFHSYIVNTLSVSSLSVYLIHTNPFFIQYFKIFIFGLYDRTSEFVILFVLALMLSMFIFMMLCFLFDRIRIKVTPFAFLLKIVESFCGYIIP